MTVRAKTNIKYGDGWYSAGDEINIRESDLPGLEGLVALPAKPAERMPENPSPDTEAPREPEGEKKPGRKPRKKAE